jgi:hypothetical protein
MKMNTKYFGAFGLFLLVSVLIVGPAWSMSSVSFKVANQGTTLASTPVVLFTSYGKLEGTTNQQGQVSFQIDRGKGFWVEINGSRLNKFFEVDTVPAVLDVAQIGTMIWNGGK